jgi:NitT/TauT family transport system substrate-binding protein
MARTKIPGGRTVTLRSVALAMAGLLSILLTAAANAETTKVRIPRQPGLTYLAFYVMDHDKLVEKQAQRLGITLEAEFVTLGTNTGSIDALLSGAVDVVSVGVPAFLTMWEKSRGNLDIKAVGAFNAIQLVLLTRNPAIKSIADYTDKSRIALPGVRASSQATILQMAAEKTFGDYTKLDALTVTRSHPDAIAALLDKNSEIDSHFSAPPYVGKELAIPGVRKILTSTEVYGGPGTIGITSATRKFHDANPMAFRAVMEALRDATRVINAEPQRIAQVFKEMTRDPDTAETIAAILTDPVNVYDFTPRGIMQVAGFMHRTGQLKTPPQDWRDTAFPELHDLPGS